MVLPLEKITVLDLSRLLPGPYCSMVLADLGANIIRVEDPNFPYGSPPPFFQKGRIRESAFNFILNRNKKSISLNLKKPEAKEIFYKLVKKADVILETYRPRVTKKLEIDYNTLSRINPSIIYCSLTGYGQTGPYELLPGHDMNYLGIAGILELNRPRKRLGKENDDRTPVVPGVQMADIGGALISVIGILSAIISRENDPERKGQYIDVSMLDCAFSFMPMAHAYIISKNLNDGPKTDNPLHGAMPYYYVYKTKDGRFLSVGAIEFKFWQELCNALNREDLKSKQNAVGEEREWVFEELQKEFLKKTMDEWVEIFKNYDTCVMPVKTPEEAFEDPQIIARNMVAELEHPKFGKVKNINPALKFSRTPLSIRSLAPKIGQHTKEILESLGYSEEEIRYFRRKKIT
ncbi:MAG: CaiB/BaiF CoA transferase family protein [Promethearchaeia archaeon]